MNKQDIIKFFDRLAPQWDRDLIKNDRIIETILQNADIGPGQQILDVACGTGVMIPYYLQKKAAGVVGIDISPEMTKIAREKFSQANVQILCGDIENREFSQKFDRIMVYNAFPHFPDPENLIKTLAGLLNPGGSVTIAHGMSRAHIDARHKGAASKVSQGLMHEDDLAALMGKYLTVTVKISNDEMYQVTGQWTMDN